MNKVLQKAVIYPLLIPVFFVLHGYNENFGLISIQDVLLLLIIYSVSSLIIFLISYLFFKDNSKAGLTCAYIMGFYLFFGALHDFLTEHQIILHKYSIILSLFLFLLILSALYLKLTKRKFNRLTLFFNTLLLIFLALDLSQIGWKIIHPNTDRLAVYKFARDNNYKPCDKCKKPDIYLLLFDEYASSISLKKRFHFDNSSMDSFLRSSGFRVLSGSHSNYNITVFSMASILNMAYINGIRNPKACTIEDFAYCQNLIRDDEVIKLLSAQGYDIINHSVFNLAGNPSEVDQSFLPLKTKLISDRTLWKYLRNDIGWELYTGKFKIKSLAEKLLLRDYNNNIFLMEQVKKESNLHSNTPRFIYGHFYLPHPPFFCDSSGRLKTITELKKMSAESYTENYLQYVKYTNKKAQELIQTIKRNSQDSAVIIFMSDHGFRQIADSNDLSNYFQNQNAIYFPDHDYSSLPDSICTVNEFRLLFNKLFKLKLPMLKDSSFFLINTYKFANTKNQ
ncbi:MAG TPA: sulfatase-like hydrolase/transferase [Puia sp.]|nr:sulfatase-like hydrolase/transferase [Puia sp.]